MKPFKPIVAIGRNRPSGLLETSSVVEPIAVALPAPAEAWADSPTFPDAVFSCLPTLFTQGCRVFTSERERDVFLLSALAVISGCLPTVTGLYDGRQVKANLFVFVVAPPASGKGVLVWAQKLGRVYHQHRIAQTDQLRQAYNECAQEVRQNKQPFEEQPPPYKSLFIPGNSSAAAFLKALTENDETGVVCETEADTLSGALKQDWGDYSDLLRKAFHHERVSYLRKSGERYEIEQPAISVLLAGTPGQVQKLIPDAENGLMSRFMFYGYDTKMDWHDVSPQSGRPALDGHFEPLAARVNQMVQRLESPNAVVFDLQPAQWAQLNQSFSEIISRPGIQQMREAGAIAYRLGLITFRIAMILSVVRMYETGFTENKLYCETSDFETAMTLSAVLLDHALLVMALLPKGGPARNRLSSGNRQLLLAGLSAEFTRAEADTIGATLGIKERTMTNYLTDFTQQGQLAKTEHGRYRKVQ